MLRVDVTLDMSCKKMSDARLDYVRRHIQQNPAFGNITTLHLYDNKITSHGMRHVCLLNPERITTIWLGHNRIRDDGVATFVAVPWPQLSQLFLDDNYIGDDGARMLTVLPVIRRLGLHTNCLTSVGIRCLQRQSYDVLWVHSQRPNRGVV